MGIFDWLFRKRTTQQPKPAKPLADQVSEITARFITIPSTGYHGLFKRSPGKV